MRPHGSLGFGLADSRFQSSLLRMGVGFDMVSWSEGKRWEKRVRIEILTQENFR